MKILCALVFNYFLLAATLPLAAMDRQPRPIEDPTFRIDCSHGGKITGVPRSVLIQSGLLKYMFQDHYNSEHNCISLKEFGIDKPTMDILLHYMRMIRDARQAREPIMAVMQNIVNDMPKNFSMHGKELIYDCLKAADYLEIRVLVSAWTIFFGRNLKRYFPNKSSQQLKNLKILDLCGLFVSYSQWPVKVLQRFIVKIQEQHDCFYADDCSATLSEFAQDGWIEPNANYDNYDVKRYLKVLVETNNDQGLNAFLGVLSLYDFDQAVNAIDWILNHVKTFKLSKIIDCFHALKEHPESILKMAIRIAAAQCHKYNFDCHCTAFLENINLWVNCDTGQPWDDATKTTLFSRKLIAHVLPFLEHIIQDKVSTLRIDGQDLKALPNSINFLQHLEGINISKNKFSDPEEECAKLVRLPNLQKIAIVLF